MDGCGLHPHIPSTHCHCHLPRTGSYEFVHSYSKWQVSQAGVALLPSISSHAVGGQRQTTTHYIHLLQHVWQYTLVPKATTDPICVSITCTCPILILLFLSCDHMLHFTATHRNVIFSIPFSFFIPTQELLFSCAIQYLQNIFWLSDFFS